LWILRATIALDLSKHVQELPSRVTSGRKLPLNTDAEYQP